MSRFIKVMEATHQYSLLRMKVQSFLSLPLSPSLSSPSLSSPSLSLSLLYFNVHVLSSDMESMMECFAAGSLIVEDSKFVHAREA